MKQLIFSLILVLIFINGYTQERDTITSIFSITNAVKQADGTYAVQIKAGRNEGVLLQNRASVLTRYNKDKNNEPRENLVIGSVEYTKIGERTSEGIFSFKSGQEKHGLLPYDMVYTQISIPKNTYRGLLFSMAKLNVLLNETPDIYNRKHMVPLYNWDTIISIKSYGDELEKIKRYSGVIHKTREGYGEDITDYPVMLTEIKGGKFGGTKMYQLLEQTREIDIIQYLEFIKEYPYKYMGVIYPLDETYATWALNNTPLTKNIESSITKYVAQLLNTNELTKKVDDYGHYFKVGVKNKSVWVEQYLDDSTYAVDEFLKVADVLNLDTFSNYLKLDKANVHRTKGKNKEALELMTEVIDDPNESSNQLNAYWYRSFVNQDLKQYEAAISDLDSVLNQVDFSGAYGSKGWLLLKTGRWKEAREPIQLAQNLDPSAFSWAINRGHMHLTKSDPDSAKYYYKKALDLASSTEDFEGGLADFDLFIKNGWYEKESKEFKDFFQWNIDSNGYFEKAKAEYFFNTAVAEKEDFVKRLELLDSAIFYQAQVPAKNYYRERSLNRWYAYTQYKLKRYDESLKWYTKALRTNRAHIKEDDLLYDDYDDLETLAEYVNDEELENWYGELKEGIKHKINVKSTSASMYVFSCGSTSDENKHSDSDAEKFLNELVDTSNQQFDQTFHELYESTPGIDFDVVLENFTSQAQEKDVLVFYFSGASFSKDENKGFVIGEDSIPIEDLITSLTFVPCENVLIVLDADNINFIENFVSYRSNLVFNESHANIQILTPNKVRYEVDSLKHGLLTYALLESLKNEEELSSFDLKQTAEEVLEEKGYYFNFAAFGSGYPFPIMTRSDENEGQKQLKYRGAIVSSDRANDHADESSKEGHYALVVGVGEYDHWASLKNPKNDAVAIHQKLQTVYQVKSTLLLNPDLNELEAALRALKNLNAESITIFYAGHGYFEDETQRGYLVLKDSKLPEKDLAKSTYFDHNRLVGLLSNYRCKNIMLLVDACFSGTIESQSTTLGEGICLNNSQTGYASDVYQDAPNKVYMKRHLSCPTMKYITSGGKEYVPDGTGDHSPFAAKLLEALDTKGGYDADGILSYSEIRVSLLKVTPQPRFGRFGEDNASTEFLLLSK